MKAIITASFLLAAVAAATGCTDRRDVPVNNTGDATPSSVTSDEADRSATTGVADVDNPNATGLPTTGTPDTNDRGTVATDMRVGTGSTPGTGMGSDDVSTSASSAEKMDRASGATNTPNAIGTPNTASPDINANSTDTSTRTTPKASDSGNGM